LTAVGDLIEERCGLRFADTQRASLAASVDARMERLGVSHQEDYLDRLRGASPHLVEAELRNLLNLVTVTETCFFRDAAQFRLLREHIIPALTASPGGRQSLRIWSAGCSSGEEAYSIALTLDDMGFSHVCADWTVEIIATDLNTKMLDAARRGVYSARAVRNLEGPLLDRYFRRDGNSFHLIDAIRERVTFEFGNLTQTPMPSNGPQDIVFCKNVGIYFRPEVMRRLIGGIHDTLRPGGYLLLGHAESLWQMSEGFELVEHERGFCYRKADRQTWDEQGSSPARHGFNSARPRETLTERYDCCLAAFRAGDWSGAESGLLALIDACPTFVPAHLLLGGVYVHRARYDEAAALAESVLRLTDLEARAHLLLGMIAARRENHEGALKSLRRALYLDDSLALAHFWLGNLYRDRGDVARAAQEYESVVRGWERQTQELTEEFASDLTAEQLVGFCRQFTQHG
jgi:chemotaxis protein methyltransferase CheR